LRLVETGGDTVRPVETLVQSGPAYIVEQDEIILVRIDLPFPESPDMVADLHTAVQSFTGEYLVPYGPNVIVYDDVFALLNAIGYIGPSP
jgi:hypothetical protein